MDSLTIKRKRKMKYNEKYDRYVTKGGLVYRYNSKQDKLVLCKLSKTSNDYIILRVSKPERAMVLVHRLVYETFVGEVPQGYELDHINTIRDDNRLENLRLVTHKDNMNNPLTLHKRVGIKTTKGHTWVSSEFGNKFKEHFGTTRLDNQKLYEREKRWYYNHNKVCRWEK